jgi:hypothetical protein
VSEEVSTGKVLKIDESLRTVYGWASVITKNDEPLVDRQGDIINEPTLQKAAHGFILDDRAGKVMHRGKRVADVVESCVLTKELQKVLGNVVCKDAEGNAITGWFIGMKVRPDDDGLWAKVVAGDFPTFSIGGQGQRVPLEDH